MSDQPTGKQPFRRAALISGISLGLGFGYTQIIRLISMVILARLLLPEAFGLMSMVSTVMIGLTLFSDLGIRISVVQHPRGDDADFLNTAWTLQIIRGFILWFGACLLAWPAAYWRPDPAPDLLWLLPLLGFTAVFDGFTSTKLFTFSRNISQGREVLIDGISHTVGVAVTITWATIDRNILALVAGMMLSFFLKMLLSHLLVPGVRNRLCWNRVAIKDLGHVAKWIYLGTMFTFVATYSDRLVVGLGSIKELGVYHFARQFADVPAELMFALGGKLIFPIYSRMLRSEPDLGRHFPRVHLLAGGLSALLVAGVLATGSTLVHSMLPEPFHDAAWILPLLAVGSWFRILASNAGAVFLAQGLVRYSAYCNIAKVASLLLFMPLGHYLDGLRGLILGFIAGDVVRYGFTVLFLARAKLFVLRDDLLWTLFVAVTGFAGSEIGQSVGLLPVQQVGRGLAYLPRLLVEGAIVVVSWGIVVWVCRQRGYFRMPSPAVAAT